MAWPWNMSSNMKKIVSKKIKKKIILGNKRSGNIPMLINDHRG
jgi:hypothetical protein